jgi:phage host-nuclease inhibitor protein Gam
MTYIEKLIKDLHGKYTAYDVTGNHNSAQIFKDAANVIEQLRSRIDELEEKQTYCDAYGDKWMTSGKDVPTEAYKHGYADGWDEAMAKMEVQDESVF